VREGDRVSILGLKSLAPGAGVNAILHHADGSREDISLRHTFTAEQIEWFKAGSAVNLLRKKSSAERS